MIVNIKYNKINMIYDERLDLSRLGVLSIRRASSVEPEDGLWYADMNKVGGPVLGPFTKRSQALAGETIWLEDHINELHGKKILLQKLP